MQRRGSELFTTAEKVAAATPVFMNTPPATPASLPPRSSSDQASSTSAQSNPQPDPQMASPISSMGAKPVACVRCKQKKIKCDGKSPSCSACVRAKEQCLIPDMVTGRAYPRGYIEHLENRVSELQSIIDTRLREARITQNRQTSFSSIHTNSTTTSDPFTPGKRSSATTITPQYADFTLSPKEEAQADLALARLLVQTLHLKDHGPCISKLSYLVSNDSSSAAQSTTKAAPLPPQSMSHSLINLYLQNEHRCFPFLSQEEIYAALRRVYNHVSVPSIGDPSSQDYFQTFMIFAIGSLSHTDGEQDPTSTGFTYYNSALHYVAKLSLMSGISAIQNLLLLCIFSLNAKISQDAWRLSRRALHICIQDELHLSRTKKGSSLRKSKEEGRMEQLKQRIFWSCYCLNRITSNLVYDRPPSIPEAEIDIEQPPATEQTFSSPPPEHLKDKKSLLSNLANLYHISTVAFTSFNSNPPKGDITEKLKKCIEEFLDDNQHVLRHSHSSYGESNQQQDQDNDLPVYVKLSYGAHPMLIFQWAVTSLIASKDGITTDIEAIALNYCIETISFITETTRKNRRCANSRISFIIALRTLFVVLSVLLAPNVEGTSEVEIPGETKLVSEKLDRAIVYGVEFLVSFGKRFGHANSFITALVLALRYGIFERERRELARENGKDVYSDTRRFALEKGKGKQIQSEDMDVDERLGNNVPHQPLDNEDDESPFLISNDEYSDIIPRVATRYPKLFNLFEELNLQDLPLNLDLTRLTSTPEVPGWAFKKFKASAPDLEVLCKQVIWRLKVQYGIGDIEGQVHAFDVRLGSTRPVEPWPQIGVGSAFNDAGQQVVPGEGDVEMGGVEGPEGYQPISGWMGGGFGGEGWGMPKMDVDFSGFETNIVTFD
ncbi:hypothetical protein TWF694_002683 [Orbilia ellipsospora]|uniref:Zn(2)-C6 fungal-type domain-containing protein n=1 Tax=Orbilia ellipsospora TaxID=2528407 RepID=A0AAV9X2X6_9PEZI